MGSVQELEKVRDQLKATLAECNTVLTEKGVDTAADLASVPERIAGIEAAGDDLFQYATNADFLFNGATFPDGYELTLNLPNIAESANRLVRFSKGLKKVTLKGNKNNNAIGLQYAFDSAKPLEIVDATEWGAGGLKPTYFNSAFSSSPVHTILGEIDCSALVNVNGTFSSALALKEIRIKAGTLARALSLGHSSLLSDESIQSIIDGLADLSGQTAQTITFHPSIVSGRLTDEQRLQILYKNWNVD